MSDRYPRRWSTACLALAGPVILVAFVLWSVPGVAVLLVMSFGITTAVLVGVATTPGSIPDPGSPVIRRAVAAAARWAVVEVAVVVCAIADPLLAVVVAVLVLGTSPWAVRRLARRRNQRRPAPGSATWLHAKEFDELSPERIRLLVRRLDVSGLCRAWLSSHALLGQVHDVEARSKVVLLRQEYLDEMERRNATGFQRWLESDAKAAGDPESFLRSGTGRDGETAA